MHSTPTLDPTRRLAYEVAYGALLPITQRADESGLHGALKAAVVQLARALGKPCPFPTRAQRRGVRVAGYDPDA